MAAAHYVRSEQGKKEYAIANEVPNQAGGKQQCLFVSLIVISSMSLASMSSLMILASLQRNAVVLGHDATDQGSQVQVQVWGHR
jgi:hypothetical protein